VGKPATTKLSCRGKKIRGKNVQKKNYIHGRLRDAKTERIYGIGPGLEEIEKGRPHGPNERKMG